MESVPIRKVLADRLRELMEKNCDLNTQVKVAKRAGVAQATIQRMLSQSGSTTIDNLERVATAFGRTAAELLEDPAGAAIPYDRKAYRKLTAPDRDSIERYIAFVLSNAALARQTGGIDRIMDTANTGVALEEMRPPRN